MIIFIVILLLIISFVLCSLNILTVKTYKDKSDKINGKIKFAVISDLHSSLYGKNQSKLIAKIKKEKPDLILMTGDVIDDKRSTKNAEIFFKQIKSVCPAYCVFGNHELKGNIEEYKKILSEHGVVLLENDFEEIFIRGEKITIAGISDSLNKTPQKEWIYSLTNLDEKTDDTSYKVLLSHRPCLFSYYDDVNFDLILCGHEHGGQFRLFGKGLYAPDEGLFPKYSYGEYKTKKGKIIVSSGLCKNAFPRFLNPPEIVIVTVN